MQAVDEKSQRIPCFVLVIAPGTKCRQFLTQLYVQQSLVSPDAMVVIVFLARQKTYK